MIYNIIYGADVERQILELPERRRAKFYEGMSHLVENPYPAGCVRSGNTVELWITQYIRVIYMVSDRRILAVVVIDFMDIEDNFQPLVKE